jgi:hypothetical protein
MKFFKRLAVVLLIASVFTACKKDKDSSSSNSEAQQFYGKWVGTYGFDNDVPAYFFSLNIASDGSIQELNSSGVAKGQGTWKVTGSTLKGTYKMLFSPYNEYSVIATINSSTGKMEGSWGYDDNGSDGGKILLSKQ